jgi:hypothetical protein
MGRNRRGATARRTGTTGANGQPVIPRSGASAPSPPAPGSTPGKKPGTTPPTGKPKASVSGSAPQQSYKERRQEMGRMRESLTREPIEGQHHLRILRLRRLKSGNMSIATKGHATLSKTKVGKFVNKRLQLSGSNYSVSKVFVKKAPDGSKTYTSILTPNVGGSEGDGERSR